MVNFNVQLLCSLEDDLSKKITIGVLPLSLCMAMVAFVTFVLSRSHAASSEGVIERVASAQSPHETWPYPDSLDAMIAAPNSHRVLLENDRVRVLEVTIPPHGKEPVHTHRWSSVMYMDVPSKFRYFDAHGKALFESGSDNRAAMKPMTMWFKPEEPHSVENLTDVPFHGIRVELKK
jgi:hypothetical protein